MLHNVLNKQTLEEKRMLVVCPSRERVEKLAEMVKSFNEKTSPSTALIVCLDDDDPKMEEYKHLLSDKVAYHIGKRTTNTNLYNYIFKMFPDFEFYALTNDDFVYLTAVWDVKLMGNIEENGGWGIAYGDDRVAHDKYPSHTIVSGNIVRALGWLQMPALKHLCGDWVWGAIGKGTGRLFYDQNVIIQHKHPFDKKTSPDPIYEKTNSQQMYAVDHDSFKRWAKTQMHQDVQKIVSSIFKEKKFDKTISLCMIIQQDEDIRNIKQCLESVKDWIDEISVYINYPNVPNLFKAKAIERLLKTYNLPNIISSGKFENFSKARNITLKQATKDFIVWLDCDDIMPAAWTMKDMICQNSDIDVFLCHVVSHANYKGRGDEHITQSRLVRRFDFLEFRNNVHEDLSFSYKEKNAKAIRTDIIIEHLGNTDMKRVSKKNLRNYKLTLQEINTEKAHSLTYFALVNELMLIGTKEKLVDAILWIDKFFEKFREDGKDPLIPKMWILRGTCALDCGQVDAARTNFAKAWHGWNHPEAAIMLGECHMKNQDWDKAIDILEEVRKKDMFEVCNVPIDMRTIDLVMLSKLGWAYYNKAESIKVLKKASKNMYNEQAQKLVIECIDNCQKCFEEYLTIEPMDLGVGDKLAYIYRMKNQSNSANAITVSLVNMYPNYAVGWKNLGTFEAISKRYRTAEVFYEKALKINPKDVEVQHNLKMIRKSQ